MGACAAGVTRTLRDAQREILTFVGPETYLVGHSLESDLRALKLIHRRLIDTSELYPSPRGTPYKVDCLCVFGLPSPSPERILKCPVPATCGVAMAFGKVVSAMYGDEYTVTPPRFVYYPSLPPLHTHTHTLFAPSHFFPLSGSCGSTFVCNTRRAIPIECCVVLCRPADDYSCLG